jgi:hypothetical protein
MKKIGLILSLMFMSTLCVGQIVVRESVKDSVVWDNKLTGLPKLINYYTSEYNSYSLHYKNAKYTTITDIDHISLGDKKTTIQFFEILKDVIDSEEKVTIELDGKIWIISKSMGSVYVWSEFSSFFISKKNLESVLILLYI